jgi:hypothetical protein
MLDLAARMRVEMGNSMSGDVIEAMAGEVEVEVEVEVKIIEMQVAVADLNWLHDQVRDTAEAIGAIEPAKPDDDALS